MSQDDGDQEEDGRMRVLDLRIRPCPLCRGRGVMYVAPDRSRPAYLIAYPCIVCKGTGNVSGL